MYCSNCGNELKDNDLFCSKCGNKIERINQQDEIKLNEEKECSNSQNASSVNQNQKVKLVFTKGVEGYFAIIGIYIDDKKRGKELNYLGSVKCSNCHTWILYRSNTGSNSCYNFRNYRIY